MTFAGCRDFHLSLVHNDGIFSSDFGAHIVGKDGLPTQVHLDRHEFYHGYLHGEDSHAYMHTQMLTHTRQKSRLVTRDVCMYVWEGGSSAFKCNSDHSCIVSTKLDRQ